MESHREIVMRASLGYNNMFHMNKNFLVTLHSLNNIEINKYFN